MEQGEQLRWGRTGAASAAAPELEEMNGVAQGRLGSAGAAGASARGTRPGDGTGLAGAGLGCGQGGDVLAQRRRQEHSQPSVWGLCCEGEGRKRISGKKRNE